MRRLVLGGLLVAPVAAIVGFVLVGWLATRANSGDFDWELASVFGTAVGTTLLALATGFLAWTTSRDVSATEKIAEETSADRIDRGRPTVIGNVVAVERSS